MQQCLRLKTKWYLVPLKPNLRLHLSELAQHTLHAPPHHPHSLTQVDLNPPCILIHSFNRMQCLHIPLHFQTPYPVILLWHIIRYIYFLLLLPFL